MKPREEWHGRNKGSAYIQWYPGDILSDGFVCGLTPIEEHCYRRLLDFNARDGFIPSDTARLAIMCKIASSEFADVWEAIGSKFAPINGTKLQLSNPRMKYELDRQKKRSLSASERGKKGGRPTKPKKTKKKTGKLQLNHSLATGKPEQSHPDPDPNPDPDPEKEKSEENINAIRVAPFLDECQEFVEGACMELAYWLQKEFGKHKPNPRYVELVFNLTNCGNEGGLLSVQPGQVPYSLEDVGDACHGFIIANYEDKWLRDQRNKGDPRGLTWLLTNRDQIAKNAELGRNQWEEWSKREQRRRDARQSNPADNA